MSCRVRVLAPAADARTIGDGSTSPLWTPPTRLVSIPRLATRADHTSRATRGNGAWRSTAPRLVPTHQCAGRLGDGLGARQAARSTRAPVRPCATINVAAPNAGLARGTPLTGRVHSSRTRARQPGRTTAAAAAAAVCARRGRASSAVSSPERSRHARMGNAVVLVDVGGGASPPGGWVMATVQRHVWDSPPGRLATPLQSASVYVWRGAKVCTPIARVS